MAGGKDINIPITGDARDFVKTTKDVEGALDDVADSLDDMTRDTKRGADQAERAVDDLADTFRDAQRRAKDLGDAGKDAGDDVKRGMERAEDGVEEFKDEANSTAREAAASFDGSAESIADMFQEVAANAFAGFGPAGAIAGLAAAAGIGLAVAGFEQVNEASEESKERANEWADAYIESGGRVLDFDTTMAKTREILTGKFDEATKNADLWGVSIETAVAAMAGSQSAIDDVTKAVDEQSKAAAIAAVKAQEMAEANGGTLLNLTLEEQKANAASDALNMLTGEMDRGASQASIYSRMLVDQARATAGATEAVDEFGDTIITLPDGKQVYIDAETGQATDNVNAIERKIYGIPDGSATVSVDTSTAQNTLDRWIVKNNGRTIQIGTRTVTSGFGNGVY